MLLSIHVLVTDHPGRHNIQMPIIADQRLQFRTTDKKNDVSPVKSSQNIWKKLIKDIYNPTSLQMFLAVSPLPLVVFLFRTLPVASNRDNSPFPLASQWRYWFWTISCSAMARTPTTSTKTATKRFIILVKLWRSLIFRNGVCKWPYLTQGYTNTFLSICAGVLRKCLFLRFESEKQKQRSAQANLSLDVWSVWSGDASSLRDLPSVYKHALRAKQSRAHRPSTSRTRWTASYCQPHQLPNEWIEWISAQHWLIH